MKQLEWGRNSGDRLMTAVFLAALLHGLLILGVRFTANSTKDRPLPTLEVLLVPDGEPEAANDAASYIAQRNQRGSGTSPDRLRTSLPEASESQAENRGEADGDSLLQQSAVADPGGSTVVSSRNRDAPSSQTGDTGDRPMYQSLPRDSRRLPQLGVNAVAADRNLQLRGRPAADDTLLADTRESVIASYLDGWKRRIERVGTLNFPNEARRRTMSGNPVLEVAIEADGRLAAVVVRRSSGHAELDEAAVTIVKLASPFDPFPGSMRERYPQLRFAYEWQFLNGQLGDSTVLSETSESPAP